MKLQDILASKGTSVYTIRPEATLQDVAVRLVERNCGSLIVCMEEQCTKVMGR